MKHCFYDTYVPREAETTTPSISMAKTSESVEGKACSTECILVFEMKSTTRSEGEVTSCVAGAPWATVDEYLLSLAFLALFCLWKKWSKFNLHFQISKIEYQKSEKIRLFVPFRLNPHTVLKRFRANHEIFTEPIGRDFKTINQVVQRIKFEKLE